MIGAYHHDGLPLFAYGTLVRDDWRRALLGDAYATAPAALAGWRRTATSTGYLSVEPCGADDRGTPVRGVLVHLDRIGWTIADAWEEVPRYERITVVVDTEAGPASAQMYVCSEAAAALPPGDDRLTTLNDGAVEAAIAAFAPTMRRIRAT